MKLSVKHNFIAIRLVPHLLPSDMMTMKMEWGGERGVEMEFCTKFNRVKIGVQSVIHQP